MTPPESDELRALRERAYGPAADIHLDSKALERLRELEMRGPAREQLPAELDEEHAEEWAQEWAQAQLPAAAEPAVPAADEDAVSAGAPRRARFRMRRSTVLIALALVALIVASNAALVLVQRVQTDPLQAGAPQVARLAEDTGYEIPEIFFPTPSAEGQEARAYDEFYGLRIIVDNYGPDKNDECILVYPAESATDPDGNFTGPGYSGCAAGPFPAAVAFRVDAVLPEQLRSAFPEGTALQFVFDEGDNEIVVFADR